MFNDAMTIWFRRCSSFEEEAAADREYWAQFTPDERVAMIDDLRRTWSTMNDDDTPNQSHDAGELFVLFERHGVRALIVGAHALAVHAKPRFTNDVDVFVEPSRENAARVVAALQEFGFGSIGLTPDDLSTSGRVVQLGFPPNRIDLMTSIDGVPFDEAWSGRVTGTYAGHRVSYIGKAELIRNKEASGRAQDLADVELLRRFT